MNHNRSLFYPIFAVVVALICILSLNACQQTGTKKESDTQQKQQTEIRSMAEVEALIRGSQAVQDPDTYADETALFYKHNNELAQDPTQPWNKGAESLSTFVQKFRTDPKYRRARMALQEGSYNPSRISEYAFVINEIDSTGFFSGWIHVDNDSAAFCSGWMNSEILEEFNIMRNDSTQPWMLVNYYHAM